MASKKILLVSHEMAPYTDLSYQSEFVRDLAVSLQKKNAEIRVFMPKFGLIKERKHRLHEVIRLSGLNITVGHNNNPLIIKVASLQTAKIQVYFLDNADFFQRKNYFQDDKKNYFEDNNERLIFFNKGVMELLVKLGWIPDIIHCQGWMSSLIPYYARNTFKNEPALKNVKISYSYFADAIDQKLGSGFDEKAHIQMQDGEMAYLKTPHASDLYKAGAEFADVMMIDSEKMDKSTIEDFKQTKKPLLDKRNLEGEDLYEKYHELITK